MKRILLLALAAPLAMAAIQEPIQVEGGQITGTPTPQWTPGVRAFRGIPYAAPPVGNLRWRPPQPVVPWSGVKAADHFSPACMQRPTSTEGNGWREGLAVISEDCLYRNVWTPAQSANAKLPVMIFIHGGGNVAGSGSENQYDGAYLVKKGVVFVNLNYRLNVFGYLAHPDLTRESEHHSSGAYGLLDQIAALSWVQRNIAKFGGDPGNVMVFGHSGGARDVTSLMASPLAKGLFHRVLSQSGVNLAKGVPLADAEKTGVTFAQSVGAQSVADLRAKPAEELLKASASVQLPLIVDGWVLPQDLYTIFSAGKQNDVPLVVGSVADESGGAARSPAKAAEVPAWAKQTFGDLAEKYLKAYPARTDEEAARSAAAFATNQLLENARILARLQASTGKSKAYWYLFTHVSPLPEGLMWSGRPAKTWGAYHGGEIVYVFNELPMQDWAWRPVDLKVGDLISSMWTNFVKTGNPNGPGIPNWPSYDPKTEMLMNIGDDPKAQPAPFKLQLEFLDEWNAAQRK